MTWQNTGLIMLRTMLNDAGCSTVKYTPQRLDDLLITAAYFLPVEINFKSTFTINVETRAITPDPGSTAVSDGDEFIRFMVLKAACIADEGNFRTAALSQGVTARCGPAVLQTSSYGQYLGTLLNEGPCKAYEEIKKKYNFSYTGGQILRAVMSPFAANSFDPTNMLGAIGEADLQNPLRNRNQYF
tara:strand:- start:1678 stop:2235 length:558 start_codon:yes stop_codon:yes gene_type:complete